MIKSRFSYLKLTALIAVFAMTLVPYLGTSAENRLSLTVASADLANEERIIPHCHPHQLRHNAATFIRKQYGIEGKVSWVEGIHSLPAQRSEEWLKDKAAHLVNNQRSA